MANPPPRPPQPKMNPVPPKQPAKPAAPAQAPPPPKKSYPIGALLKYKFENLLSKGAGAIIGLLGVSTVLLVLIAGAVGALTGVMSDGGTMVPSGTEGESVEKMGFFEAMWQSLMRTFDAGNMAGDSGIVPRIIFVLVTLGGIFIVGSLIGTITSGLESKLDDMRKGRSKVLEDQHTLILGWSSKIFSIISELLIANENKKRPRIVILADRDKVEMEDEIRARFPSTKNTKIICRSGSPLDLTDLDVASPHDAKSIVILSPEGSENPDTHVIKSILAITNNPNRRKSPYHIVAEIRDEENMEAATLVGGKEAVLVLAGDLIARVTAQTCRQSGLSVVYTELLDFDGAEIYFTHQPSLAGKTYRDAVFAFEDSAVMGVFFANGTVRVNPEMDLVLGPKDQLIAIAEDDDSLRLSGKSSFPVNETAIRDVEPTKLDKERTLILGWNDKGSTIITELDNYVGQGSEILVVAANDASREACEALQSGMSRATLTYRNGKITNRAQLDELDVTSWDHIIVLTYTDIDMQEADAQTLICLLHLRAISDQTGKDLSIVSEMLDIRNRDLAEVTRADDFIVSDKLISLMLSQLSENKHLKKVFDDLFTSEGSEIYLKPVSDYVATGVKMDYYTLLESAARKGQTCIGYRIQAQSSDSSKGYGVKVNPVKSQQVVFTPEDKVIVLAED